MVDRKCKRCSHPFHRGLCKESLSKSRPIECACTGLKGLAEDGKTEKGLTLLMESAGDGGS